MRVEPFVTGILNQGGKELPRRSLRCGLGGDDGSKVSCRRDADRWSGRTLSSGDRHNKGRGQRKGLGWATGLCTTLSNPTL